MNCLRYNNAAGVDGVVNEHLIFGTNRLVVHQGLLFNAMVRHSFVPRYFCYGTVVPPLKNKHGDASQLDICRNINLSPVVSKRFESMLLICFKASLSRTICSSVYKKEQRLQ